MFYGIFIIFQEVTKLKGFEFDITDIIGTNAYNILPGFFYVFFLYIFVNLMEKDLLQSFLFLLIIFDKVMK